MKKTNLIPEIRIYAIEPYCARHKSGQMQGSILPSNYSWLKTFSFSLYFCFSNSMMSFSYRRTTYFIPLCYEWEMLHNLFCNWNHEVITMWLSTAESVMSYKIDNFSYSCDVSIIVTARVAKRMHIDIIIAMA